MLENIAGNSSMLVGKAAEARAGSVSDSDFSGVFGFLSPQVGKWQVGQKHGQHDATKQQMHQMLEDMFSGEMGIWVVTDPLWDDATNNLKWFRSSWSCHSVGGEAGS